MTASNIRAWRLKVIVTEFRQPVARFQVPGLKSASICVIGGSFG
jgi:hypothetical protein